jgi:hypothetical protein
MRPSAIMPSETPKLTSTFLPDEDDEEGPDEGVREEEGLAEDPEELALAKEFTSCQFSVLEKQRYLTAGPHFKFQAVGTYKKENSKEENFLPFGTIDCGFENTF